MVSGPVSIGGFEEGKLESDGPTEEVVAQIRLRRTDPVQLSAQKIDKAAKIRIVMQPDPLGVHEVVGQRLRRADGPVEIEPLGHDEDMSDHWDDIARAPVCGIDFWPTPVS